MMKFPKLLCIVFVILGVGCSSKVEVGEQGVIKPGEGIENCIAATTPERYDKANMYREKEKFDALMDLQNDGKIMLVPRDTEVTVIKTKVEDSALLKIRVNTDEVYIHEECVAPKN